jgi:protein SCO1
LLAQIAVPYVCAAAEGDSHQAHASPAFERDRALEISRAALGKAVPNVEFQDQQGNPVALADYLGKPLVVSMIYTSCYHICPTTTRHLDQVVRQGRSILGSDSFNVISVGFDPFHDTPPMMQQFAVQQGVSDERWKFLAADQQSVDRLARAIGFQYIPSASGFDHLLQTTLIAPDGRVFQQIYGMTFDAPLLIEPLKEFVFGVSSSDTLIAAMSKRVRLFCTVYDPAMERYKFDYSLFIGMFIGFACVGVLGFQLVREWRKTLAAGV